MTAVCAPLVMPQAIRSKKKKKKKQKTKIWGNSLAVQWLGLCAFTAESPGSITGWGAKIPTSHVAWPKEKTVRLVNWQ